MQGRENVAHLACTRQYAMSVDQCTPSLRPAHSHTVYAALLSLAAMYVAGAALHDQPYRALHGIVIANTVDAVLLTLAYHTTRCKRKPL